MPPSEEEVLLQEYIVCNNKAHSYMTVCWQIGVIFISASILMLGYSVQVYPKPIGVWLIPISWITLAAWYFIFKRINWICGKAYDRAKAIEEFMKGKYHGIDPLSYTDREKKTIETKPINSWIDSEDKDNKTAKLGTKYVQIVLGLLVTMSLILLHIYVIS